MWPIGEYVCQLPDGGMLRLNCTTQNRIVEVLEMKAWMPRLGAASSIAESVALGQKWYPIIDRDTKYAEQFRRLVHELALQIRPVTTWVHAAVDSAERR